jgi:hypothetical protein
MTLLGLSSKRTNNNKSRAGRVSFYIPTLGAMRPRRRWGTHSSVAGLEKANARATAKYRDLSTAQWTMELSIASVEMTFH